MNILVMGGTQFVSKALAIFLINKGHRVSIFTRNKLPVYYEGIERHFVGNRKVLTDLEQLKGIDFDIVFDISAYELQDIMNLFSYLNTSRLKKYVFCSSGAVYTPTMEKASESFECGYNPNWEEYGLNKLKIEEFLTQQFKQSGFPMTIVRPTYIYGVGNNLYREGFFFERISQRKMIPIPESDAKVQYIYIDDLLNILEELMYSDKTNGQIFNVTHPEEISWEDLAKIAFSVMGCETKIKKVKYQGKLKPREFFPFRDCTYLLSIEKLKEYTISIPQIDLRKGLELSYKWFADEKPKLSDKKMCQIEEAIQI